MTGSLQASHEQHRVLTIRGRGRCDSECVFCVEKFSAQHPNSPTVDQTLELIRDGRGRFNMLFFAAGEPTINPKLFEYVALAREAGYRYFGMASHFRALANAHFASRVLDAGFEYFDLSLHAGTLADQLEVNPIADAGHSLREALQGVRNTLLLAARMKKRVNITHKVVITRLNHHRLLPIFDATYRLGVRHYILQPVRVEGLEPALAKRLAIPEAEFMPFVNDLLERTEDTSARFKLYGMSREQVYPSRALEEERNVVRNMYGKRPASQENGPGLAPTAPRAVSGATQRKVTLHRPGREAVSFECGEDEYVLSAALARGYDVSHGCRMGSCAMCCSKLVEGQVDQSEQLALTESQVGRGFVLLCRSRPRSDVVVMSDQENQLD